MYLNVYGFLIKEQRRILDNLLLSKSIVKFREYFKLSQEYTDQKIIDTLLWKFTAGLRSGALIHGELRYS